MLEKTSKLISSIHEFDDESDDEFEEIDYDAKINNLFDMFSNGKTLRINYDNVKSFFSAFNKMINIINQFEKPNLVEYFSKTLGYTIIIDFVISFFRTNNQNFTINNATKNLVFEFFVKLSDFYFFINYLDLDSDFTYYVKCMLTLFALRLDRPTFEKNFYFVTELLDEFFINEIMIYVFDKYYFDDHELESLKDDIDEFKKEKERREKKEKEKRKKENKQDNFLLHLKLEWEQPQSQIQEYYNNVNKFNERIIEIKKYIDLFCKGINLYQLSIDHDTICVDDEHLINVKIITKTQLLKSELTFIENLQLDKIFDFYKLSCEFGNFDAFKELYNICINKDDRLFNYQTSLNAMTSPNRQISAYFVSESKSETLSSKIKSFNEPKILFNYVNY
jgi:hypothetical protein